MTLLRLDDILVLQITSPDREPPAGWQPGDGPMWWRKVDGTEGLTLQEAFEKLNRPDDILFVTRRAGKETEGTTCRWRYDQFADYWETDCGATWVFSDEGPRANDAIYCPRCGRPLTEVWRKVAEPLFGDDDDN